MERAHAIGDLGQSRPSRHQLPDLDSLAASMALEGLRHPVLLMPGGQLLKGFRRVAAARLLGWSTINARTVHTMEEAADAIIGQRDETCRPRQVDEWVELGLTIELLDRRERPERGKDGYDSYTVVGPAVTSSGAMYKRARVVVNAARSGVRPARVVEVAKHALDALNAGSITVNAAHDRVRAAEKADPIDGLGADGLPLIPPPTPNARSPKARQLRVDWIRALAAKGATSAQIAEQLGITLQGLKKIAHSSGITISADQALNRQQRKATDPNRAARVVVSDLDALVWSLERIDTSALDPIEAGVWAKQLRDYARSISRVSSKMAKEHIA